MLRAKPEKKEEKERVRHALLRATLRLSASHGFASLGLREVSREADIAPTSFYRHFADMEELGLALIEELVGPVLLRFAESAQTAKGDRQQVVLAVVDAVLGAVAEDPELIRFMVAERVGAVAAFRAALSQKLVPFAAVVQEALESAHTGRPMPVPTHLADATVVLVLEGAHRALDRDAMGVAALGEQLIHQLHWLLSAEGGERRT